MHRWLPIAAVGMLALTGSSSQAGIPLPPTPGDSQPTISHDASAIVFYRSANWYANPHVPGSLWVTRPDGTDARQLAGLPTDTPYFALSRTWHWIAFSASVGDRPALLVMRPDGGERRVVALGVDGNDYLGAPSFAPDEQRLAYVRRGTEVWTVGIDGRDPRPLVAGSSPRWSPDGRRIAVTELNDLAIVRPDGGDLRMLHADAYSPHAVWVSDGSKLAFISRRQPPRDVDQVVVVSANGVVLGTYPSRPNPTAIAWAPDGRSFVYAASGRSVKSRIVGEGLWRVELGKKTLAAQTRLAWNRPGAVGELAWAPSAGWLVASAGGECRDRLGLYRLDAASRTPPVRISNDCHIRGTSADDDLTGTLLFDIVLGFTGDDRLTAIDGFYYGDDVHGGPGDDTLNGGWGRNTLDGGPGDDTIAGGASRDTIKGGPGKDLLKGEGGSDRIHARDGERDVVDCGWNNATTGPDTAWVDRSDVVRHCQRVQRR
jgi:RTX calcium-binding nonapeptide repeat (4 copies)/WD40-like Beta Propeller Repeat